MRLFRKENVCLALALSALLAAPARLTQGGNTIDTTEVLTSFWQNRKGERIGFASNWTRHPARLTLAWPDGTRETRLLAPLETVTLR